MQNEYAERLKDSTYLIVTDFGGLTNKDMESLRKKLRPTSAKYIVVKNSLCRTALKGLKIDGLVEMITGACGLGYGKGDPISVSKVMMDFAKDNKNLKLKGGYIDSKIVTIDTIKEFASLPSKEALIARLLSCMNSPITGFVSVCSGVMRKFVYAVNEIAKKKQENK
jgi:large subunit ribosomal protein L10